MEHCTSIIYHSYTMSYVPLCYLLILSVSVSLLFYVPYSLS